jgi:hypothetical protein
MVAALMRERIAIARRIESSLDLLPNYRQGTDEKVKNKTAGAVAFLLIVPGLAVAVYCVIKYSRIP